MKALKVMGLILFYGCGLYLYIVAAIFYWAFYGLTGLIIGLAVFPAAEIFPIIAWIITKEFPLLLFLIWFSGLAGMIMASIASHKLKED